MTPTSPPLLESGAASSGRHVVDLLGRKWAALHQAAEVVAALAAVTDTTPAIEVREFPATVRSAGGWRLALAEQGLDDLTAVMEPGLAALLAIHGQGADPVAAAEALWEEFAAARAALLALVPAGR